MSKFGTRVQPVIEPKKLMIDYYIGAVVGILVGIGVGLMF